MASQSISTADCIEVTTETLYFEKYLIVLRETDLPMIGTLQYECMPWVGISGYHT